MWFARLASIFSIAALTVFGTAQPTYAQQTARTFTLQPGGTATVTFEAFCTDFGKQFPMSIQAPNDTAPDKVRAALSYIQSNNLAADQNKALEAQYGIWQVQGAADSPSGGDITAAVVSAANTAPATPQGTSVIDAAKAGQIRVSLTNWQPLGNQAQVGATKDHFYGRGTMTVENTSQQELTLYVPLGALFPPATAGEQTMAGYATNIQVSNPQQQAPERLPATGGPTDILPWLFAIALGSLVAGWIAIRSSTRGI